jgi:carbamoyltransferase
MYYISFAENAHDSCITVASKREVLLHLELERFFNVKRYRLSDIQTFSALISILKQELEIVEPITFIISRHNGEKLYPQIIEYLYREHKRSDVIEVEHLDCHAGFSYISPFENALVLSMDGGGDRRIPLHQANCFIYHYQKGKLNLLGCPFEKSYDGFDGKLWAIVAHKLFDDVHGAGKVMGLAAYGRFDESYRDVFLSKKFEHLGWVFDKDSLNRLSAYLKVNTPDDAANLAFTLQEMYTDNLVKALSKYRFYSDNLVLTGGCALNVVTNTELGEKLGFHNVYVPSCPGDEGQSLGALLYHCGSHRIELNVKNLPYLGAGKECNISKNCYKEVVDLLLNDKIVAWHIGRSETGPRALGHRSFLALPTKMSLKTRVSEIIKKREWFRPVAPVVMEEYADDWFEFRFPSPYMSFIGKAKPQTQELAPAIVHFDGTSRIQTVTKEVNPELHELIARVYEITGIPILINTSLNLAGLPICNTEQNTKELYVSTVVDAMNLNGALYIK